MQTTGSKPIEVGGQLMTTSSAYPTTNTISVKSPRLDVKRIRRLLKQSLSYEAQDARSGQVESLEPRLHTDVPIAAFGLRIVPKATWFGGGR